MRVAQAQSDGSFQVFRAANALLANIGSNVDDGRQHALGDKATAVAHHAHRLAIARKQRVRSIAHISAGGRVGGQHAAARGAVFNQQVNAHGACGVQTLDGGHRGDIKAQRRHHNQGLGRRRGAGFNLRAQVFEQLVQLGTARSARRDPHGRHLRHFRHGRLGGHLGHAAFVTVKALAHFFAHHTASQALRGDHARTVARFVVILAVDGFHHGVGHIQRRQIHQLKGA